MMQFILGLDRWVKVYCAFLFLAFVAAIAYSALEAWAVGRGVRRLIGLFGKAGQLNAQLRRRGRPLQALESLRETAGHLENRIAENWWARIDESLAPYQSRGDSEADGWFLISAPSDILTEDAVIYRYYSAGFHGSVPGLLTSLGLLGTFIALLVGLSGLHTEGEMIKGVPDLVSSLSGKFTTSVVALFLSAAFTVFESAWLAGRLRRARARLIGALEAALPTLSAAQVMLDLRAESLKQTVSLGNISSEIVYKFANVFREEISPSFAQGVSHGVADELSSKLTPTLDSLNATLQEVGGTIKQLETGKQESVVGELRGLTQSLQESLRSSLLEMGEQFRSALSGSARDEFGGVSKTLRESAVMLGSMNETFASMQSALGSLIDHSRQSTSEQLSKSTEQTEKLTALVEGLLVRLNDSASQNANHVSAVLTGAVADLSEKVTGLSKQLVEEVSAATARSQASVVETMSSATEWSSQTNQQLATLIETLQSKANDFERAGQTLMAAQDLLERTTRNSAASLAAMQEAAAEVKTYSSALGGLQRSLTEESKAQRDVSLATKVSIDRLGELSNRHADLLREYDEIFQRSEQIFAGLDDKLRRVLETILEKVQQYNQGVERNFSALVNHVNQTMPQMGEVLAGAAVELREQVDELTEVLQTRLPALKS